MTKYIEFSGKHRGEYFAVDDEDFPELSKYTWYLDKHGYPSTTIKAHQMVMGACKRSGRVLIDHQDGDRTNECKNNLRIATNTQNMQNRKLDKRNKVGYKGVVYRPQYTLRPYASFIGGVGAGKRQIYLGCYDNPVDAARAYDRKAKELYGDFARLNFPEEL